MKKFWTASSIIAILAVGGWIYRDQIPYLDKVPFLSQASQTAGHKPGTEQATAQANGQPAGQEAGKPAGQGSGQGSGQGNGKSGGRRNGGPASVKTVAVSMGNLPMDATATGWAEAEDTTTLAALKSGLLQDVIAKDGQEVKAGDLIARLDDRIAKATVDKDQANIVSDQASLAEYEAALTRAESLLKQNAQSQQAYEQAKASRDSAAAKVDADKATLASDMVDLEHMKIRAPFDGRLGSIQLSIGAYVSAGTAIVSITRYNPIYVKFQMAERYLPQLHQAFAGKDVVVDVDPASTGGVPVQGKLSFFDNSVDTSSGTILVKAEFQNDKGILWPGQSANVTVRFQTEDRNILVPTVAVRPGAEGFFVYTVNGDSKVKATKVSVLRANGDMTAIASGLKEGDHVVVEGQVQLADGQTVLEQFAGQKVAENEPKDITR
ncbi:MULTISPECIES: efflux RND transporter periplasmic adaptor subunit [Rhizobium/Agrobacterium group]|uniref:HlyD family secretion protein n=2 Tax=Rhizobium/Agrobacterium group TaxID=227290 RepID=B9JU62_ALLAM|nr:MULTISPECIES: efflux RND transporter periplasmic adaptor subunit [Rhizobium/Agrobacterium group]ACM35990.1 HlyD family secretion protein [Allorhizobium ampelinum S4]MCF1492113.1 efflux RND transporter periplasmic adaptor subunit [Allorhizobium ampelinum]MUO29628.1 efflux RND transporter periplasmic adaptor subunit [Agrobacterium vitis]MUO43941.1 efflux RND transporter periplasmic adaptor subunit [Agrobacterium vitis]MUP11120.1 efflux RND transporter periplasmic adaptor subunit [Agrobacteriu